MENMERFCCQNSQCSMYGLKGQGNLGTSGWMDRAKTIRRLWCSACDKRFSQRKGTPLYRAKMPVPKILAIFGHAREGCGVRQTGRLVGVDKDSANRLIRLAGEHAAALHDELVAFSPEHAGSAV